MKNPTLHITMTDLDTLLSNMTGKPSAMKMILEAHKQGFQIRDRMVNHGTKKAEKIEKMTAASSPEVFHGILKMVRMREGHKVMTNITKTSAQYTTLVTVTGIADEFCQEFCLRKEIGYPKFIEMGLKLMGRKYNISKFIYYADKIVYQYETSLLIKNDDQPDSTAKLYKHWCNLVAKRTGIKFVLDKEEQYADFVLTRQVADAENAKYLDWLTAQFDEMAFMGVPESCQLHTENAVTRYKSWIFKKKAGEYNSDEEEFDSVYLRKLKNNEDSNRKRK